jgi:hypothetical protein
VYNDGNSSSSGSVSFANTEQPFFFDAWTGEQTPVFQYIAANGYTTIPLSLAPKQSVIIAFLVSAPCATPQTHVTSAPPDVLGYSYSKSSGLIAKIPSSASSSMMSTSDGRKTSISPPKVASAFTLGNWTLVAEKWGPPTDLNDISTIALKTNTTHTLPTLLSWPLIPGLETTSGLGYYSTSFSWADTSVGAIIDFGRVVHTLRVRINGHSLQPLDFAAAKSDIQARLLYLRHQYRIDIVLY